MGLYQLLNDGRIARYTGTPLTGWEVLDNNPATTAIVADTGTLYQLLSDGRIARYTGTPLTGWEVLDNNPATIAIAAAGGVLYQLLSDGRIARYTGTPLIGWEVLDNNPATRAIAAAGSILYQLLSDGRIARYTGTPLTGWEVLDNNPATTAIVADTDGGLYQLLNDGRIAQYTGTPLTGWEVLDNNPAIRAIAAAGGALYQLLSDGRIKLYTRTPFPHWEVLDNNPATTSLVATARALYQLLSDGRIARYTGTPLTGWEVLDNNPVTRAIAADASMISGYPDRPSVSAGDTLLLHISTDAPQFRVDFYRQGQTLEFKQSSSWQPGQLLPSTYPSVRWDQDWGWPSYAFAIPPDWPSGAYIAMLREGDGNGHVLQDVSGNDIVPDQGLDTSYGQWGKVLFVVKSATPGQATSILYKLSWATYHAYNWAGSGSLYRNQDHPGIRDAAFLMKVTTHRPGGGTGSELELEPGNIPSPPYHWNPATPNESNFTQYDPYFIGWLEENGYQVEYCTDLDIHEDTHLELLGSYTLLLSVGHDEYWSPEMRTHVETYRDNGGNVAFFSGNTCWWRIHFVDNDNAGHPTAFICDKSWAYDAQLPILDGYYHVDQWYAANIPDIRTAAENSLTGVSFRNGGSTVTEPRLPLGYTVQHATHWVYNGTGLHDGDVFGDNERLVGYECDGAFFDPNQHDSQGYFFPTGTDGTPPNFVILGIAKIPNEWGNPPRESFNDALSITHAATMGLYESAGGGTVFTCGTTDWSLALGRLHEPHVEQITRNVIDRMGGSPKGKLHHK